MATKKTIEGNVKTNERVFLRTVTYHYTGEIVFEDERVVRLRRAAWIADSGRFADAMRIGASAFSEVEPYPDEFVVEIHKGAVVDIVRNWPHELPREQK